MLSLFPLFEYVLFLSRFKHNNFWRQVKRTKRQLILMSIKIPCFFETFELRFNLRIHFRPTLTLLFSFFPPTHICNLEL